MTEQARARVGSTAVALCALWDALQGTRTLKIDPNFQPPTFCAQMVNANHSDPRGCFVLNHDDPTLQRDNYNTTEDVIAILGSAELRPVGTPRCACVSHGHSTRLLACVLLHGRACALA